MITNTSSINNGFVSVAINQEPSSAPTTGLNLYSVIEDQERVANPKWNERAVAYLNRIDKKLEEKLPNFAFQNKIDEIGRYVQKKFSFLNSFNDWLNSNGHGTWCDKLATCLAKLPVRVARNIVNILYNIVKGCLYAAVHPLKSLNHLAKLLVMLCHELTKPETWSKMGAGMIGTSLGQGVITGNPLSIIGLGIGGAMVVGGITVGSLKAAIEAVEGNKLQSVNQHLLSQMQELPESFLTGFCMGLIMGGVQRAFVKKYIITDSQEAEKIAAKFVDDHNLRSCAYVTSDPSTGNITLHWNWGIWEDGGWHYCYADLTLTPNGCPEFVTNGFRIGDIVKATGYCPPEWGIDLFTTHLNWTYPASPESVLLNSYGPVTGASAVFNSTFNSDEA